MTGLQSLPPELLPEILQHLSFRWGDLYRFCLVNRLWCIAARPLLYEWIRLRDTARVPQVFTTLASSPALCAHVCKLELRVWPLSASRADQSALSSLIVETLEYATNLRSLLWTRNGSLSDDVLAAVSRLPHLEEFEINAHCWHPGPWEPTLLLELPKIKTLSLLLPDRRVADLLPEICARQASRTEGEEFNDGLQSLSILSRDSPVLTADHLSALGPYVSSLTSLTLTGCPKIHDDHLRVAFSHSRKLRHLALEGVGTTPALLSSFAASATLPDLRSFKTTHPGPGHRDAEAFYPALGALVQASPELEALTHYCPGVPMRGPNTPWPRVPLGFIETVALWKASKMKRFEVNGIILGLTELEALCKGLPLLEHLVFHLAEKDVPRLARILSHLECLRTLHILSRHHPYEDVEVLYIAQNCASTLRHIGARSRVWVVARTPWSAVSASNGEKDAAIPSCQPDRLSGSLGHLCLSDNEANEHDEDYLHDLHATPGDASPTWSVDSPPVSVSSVGAFPLSATPPKSGMSVTLQRYDEPFWPEALLVVRT